MGEEPVEVGLWSSHTRISHKKDSARVLEKPAFLGDGEGWFGTEDCGVNAGGYGV